jgi:hypothetical protein
MTRSFRWWIALAGCLLVTTAAGCSTSSNPAASSTAKLTNMASTASKAQPTGSVPAPATARQIGPVESTPPSTIPPIPDGTYRTEITTSDLAAAGLADIGQPGISTLTIKDGTYALGCVAGPGTDCGGTPPGNQRKYIEVGSVRGDGSTVWFIQNMALKAKLTGCDPDLSEDNPAACGPNGSYRFTWMLTNKGLSMRNFYGLGDLAGQGGGYFNYTFKPWEKIA